VLSVVVVVFLIIRPFLFQAFYIPSDSMVPTLLGPHGSGLSGKAAGDRLLVNKLIYRLGDPQRFDIAVFRAPRAASADEKEFIKRVIGLPGETIEVAPGQILVDGRTAIRLSSDPGTIGLSLPGDRAPDVKVERNVATLPSGYSKERLRLIAAPPSEVFFSSNEVRVRGQVELSDPKGYIQESQGLAVYGGDSGLAAKVYSVNGEPRLIVVSGSRVEYQPGHVSVNGHPLRERYLAAPPGYTMAAQKLGPDEYFMMGDNRNNSNDSHAWGPLKRERVIGRAEIVFWPFNRFHVFQWWLIFALIGLFVGYQALYRSLGTR
jgi:signal peptidase I